MSNVKYLRAVLFTMILGAAAMGCNAEDPEGAFNNTEDPNLPRDGGSVGTEAGVMCTAEKSVCLNAALPDPLTGAPTRLSVAAWEKVPIVAPPNGLIGMFEMPQGNAGDVLHVSGTHPDLTGQLYVVATLYMPGGGTIVPVPGVDFIASSADTYAFGAAPINVKEVLHFELYGKK